MSGTCPVWPPCLPALHTVQLTRSTLRWASSCATASAHCSGSEAKYSRVCEGGLQGEKMGEGGVIRVKQRRCRPGLWYLPKLAQAGPDTAQASGSQNSSLGRGPPSQSGGPARSACGRASGQWRSRGRSAGRAGEGGMVSECRSDGRKPSCWLHAATACTAVRPSSSCHMAVQVGQSHLLQRGDAHVERRSGLLHRGWRSASQHLTIVEISGHGRHGNGHHCHSTAATLQQPPTDLPQILARRPGPSGWDHTPPDRLPHIHSFSCLLPCQTGQRLPCAPGWAYRSSHSPQGTRG